MNRAFLGLIVVLTGFWLVGANAVQAEKRIALVIGNSAYSNISELTNPKNDAELMVTTLGSVGFEVVSAFDANFQDMSRAVKKFGKKLRSSGENTVGLFYYAGHGVQANGTNYLIPLETEIESTSDLNLEALNAADILDQMEDAGNRLNLVILDACRNNPFRGNVRSGGRGLARMNAARGSLIAFSTAPGQVAADGEGRNSPYTEALVEAIKRPGLAVEQVFKQARISVGKKTGKRQTPWEESSLEGDFYFVPGAPGPIKQQVTAPSTSEAERIWNQIKSTTNIEILETYSTQYKSTFFATLAQARIEELNKSKNVAILVPNPVKIVPNPDRVSQRRGQYLVMECGAIKDELTGLTWYVGPDRNTTWHDAQSWTQNLRACGGGWRSPSIRDIKTIYDPAYEAGVGFYTARRHWPAHMHPVFDQIGGGSWIWSKEAVGRSKARSYNMNQGLTVKYSKSNTRFSTRAFAVK